LRKFAALLAGDMAVKDKTVGIKTLHQHPFRTSGRPSASTVASDMALIVRLGLTASSTTRKQRERFLRGGKITGYYGVGV